MAAPDPQWPAQFRGHASRIAAALGPLAPRIEHVGSTSVRGLLAKPVIDIVLEVGDAARESHYLPHLGTAGYRLRIREPDWFGHRMLTDDHGAVNLHVFSASCPQIDAMLRFGDGLRVDHADRKLYAAALV